MNKWSRVEWLGAEPRQAKRPYVADDRRPAAAKPSRSCTVCGASLRDGVKGDTCPRERSRCFYEALAASAGAALPTAAQPMVVRPGQPEAPGGQPEMVLVVPSLAELAAQVTQERAA